MRRQPRATATFEGNEMTDCEIYESLTGIFRELFSESDVVLSSQTTAKDVPGWDSINHINLILAVEQRFDIRMSTQDIDELKNVGDLLRVIKNKLS